MEKLVLISHVLCPYVQRAVIALTEKNIPFEKKLIDLANKPDWFLELSPTGKVPVLLTGDDVIFESSVIVEYIEDITDNPLHPSDALERAKHRSWMEYGSTILNGIGGLYSAADKEAFDAKTDELRGHFETLEAQLNHGPYFAGENFGYVDAVFGPVFRYFDVIDTANTPNLFEGLPKVRAWRAALAERPSIQNAVAPNFPELLTRFIEKKNRYLTSLMPQRLAA